MASICTAVFFLMFCISLSYSYGCTKLPASAAFRGTCYFQYVHGRGFIRRVCPPGTRYSEAHCGCIRASPASLLSARRSGFLPSLLSALRARTPSSSFEPTSKEDDDDDSSRRFNIGSSIRSRISQLLYGRRSYDDDDDDKDDKEREKEERDDDDEKGIFSPSRLDFGKSIRSRINQILFRRPFYGRDDDDDRDEKEREKEDGDDDKGIFSPSRFDFGKSIRSRINQLLFRRPSYSGGDDDDNGDRDKENDDNDDYRQGVLSSNRFDVGRPIRSRINQILSGRPFYYGSDNDDKDEKDDNDDDKRGLVSGRFDIGRSVRSRINQILFSRRYQDDDSNDDKYENEREKEDDGDDRGRLYRYLKKSARTVDRDNDNDDLYSRFRIKNGYLLDADDKDEIDREDRFDGDKDDSTTSVGYDNGMRRNKESIGISSGRGDSSFTGESSDSDKINDKDDDGYSTYSPGFTKKYLMTKGRKYRFEDLLDNGFDDDEDDDDNNILLDFGGIFEKKFYGLFEYVDDVLDDVFDDDFEDFYEDLFDDDGYDDVFAPKYAHYFKDNDEDIEKKYEDFEEFFENYSKLSSIYEDDHSGEDSREYGDDKGDDTDDRIDERRGDASDDDKRDEKRGDDYGDGKEDADDFATKSDVWSGRSGLDIHRNSFSNDRDDDADERDKKLFDFTSTLKGVAKPSKTSESLTDIDSILERFYDN